VSKPLVAAVNGFAMGGGTELALACDLVVASEQAVFGLPEVKRGLLAAAGGVVRLQRQIPIKLALQMALTGDPVPAATALAWALVNDAVPAGQVVTRAVGLAGGIAENAPLSVQYTKATRSRARPPSRRSARRCGPATESAPAGLVHPESAPRFSRTPGVRGGGAALVGEHTEAVLGDLGLSEPDTVGLRKSGTVFHA
jgi:enoyl-CoA hydratase/carnithine racemase